MRAYLYIISDTFYYGLYSYVLLVMDCHGTPDVSLASSDVAAACCCTVLLLLALLLHYKTYNKLYVYIRIPNAHVCAAWKFLLLLHQHLQRFVRSFATLNTVWSQNQRCFPCHATKHGEVLETIGIKLSLRVLKHRPGFR